MPTVIPADDAILERILETTYPTSHQGLSRSAFTKLDAAQRKTIWGLGHQRRFALVEKDEVLASAQRYALNGALDRRRVSICGIGAVCTVSSSAASAARGRSKNAAIAMPPVRALGRSSRR